MKNISVSVESFGNYTSVYDLSSCGFAFVTTVEDEYDFSVGQLKSLKTVERVPLVLDWTVGKKSCDEARKGPSKEFLCGEYSRCVDAENESGYTCKCLDGYDGNPYLPTGCQDIDECTKEEQNECVYAKECKNTGGNYTCGCPERHHGDGRKGGQGCVRDQTLLILITVGTCSGVVALLVRSGWIYLIYRKRKFIKLQEMYFKQNGGLMLQQRLSRQDSSIETAQIFTADELKKATNNYDEARIVGSGGFGTIYKGILPANRFQKGGQGERLVAIKKSKIVDRSQIEQFINEVIVLSQINHRNVVKLLGCCLQTEVPLLVYEFVSNGTLSDHIHSESKASGLTWDTRLRIAAETAGVLSYLHSAASTPIIHRDVKSTNILLDENYTAKVSDFGTSRLVPVDQTQLSTMVQGTLGYLDPEYLLTSELTEKSDVYSFGVLVVELLTAQKALSFDRPENERSLAMYFLLALKEERMFESLDNHVLKDGSIEQLKEVAGLVKRCLRVRGEERPTMKEVAMELEGIRMMGQHPWVQNDLNSDENVHLLGETSDNYNYGESVNLTTVYDSMRGHVILPEGNGR